MAHCDKIAWRILLVGVIIHIAGQHSSHRAKIVLHFKFLWNTVVRTPAQRG